MPTAARRGDRDGLHCFILHMLLTPSPEKCPNDVYGKGICCMDAEVYVSHMPRSPNFPKGTHKAECLKQDRLSRWPMVHEDQELSAKLYSVSVRVLYLEKMLIDKPCFLQLLGASAMTIHFPDGLH